MKNFDLEFFEVFRVHAELHAYERVDFARPFFLERPFQVLIFMIFPRLKKNYNYCAYKKDFKKWVKLKKMQ